MDERRLDLGGRDSHLLGDGCCDDSSDVARLLLDLETSLVLLSGSAKIPLRLDCFVSDKFGN